MNEEQLIKSMMENYPEASNGNSLTCIEYNYNKMVFIFIDEETDKLHTVNMLSLKKGLKKLLKIIEEGKYFNCGVVPHLLSEGYNYDAQDCDALVQCVLFGKVIYG